MTTQVRLLIAGVTLAAVFGLISWSGASYAGDAKDIPGSVKKIAELIKKGDDAGAKKMAKALADGIPEEDIGNLMDMFKTRTKGGLGIGEKAGANPAKDGIEVALRDLARDVPNNVAKQAEALETTGYWIAAIATTSHAKSRAKDMGKKTKKAWNDWSEDMRVAGIGFAKAAAGKGGQQIKTAAAKVNAVCNNCHSVFKD